MKGHFKSKKHLMKIGTVAVASAIWVVIRTGRKPSRIVYPCQRTALANIHVFLLLAFAPLLDSGRLRKSLPYVVNHPLTKAVCLLSLLLLALGSVTVTNNMSPGSIYLPVPLILKTQRALDTVSSSDIFFVESSSGFEGNMDDSVSRLLQLMEDHEKFFFETASQPAGLIHKDDVVLIKVNCQWSQRGGTNTDLVKSLIEEIVDHPEGFTGEIIVADNGQGRGSLDWAGSNAHNHSQSMQDVVNGFSSFKVSTWLWDPMRTLSVSEYNEADFNDGYIVNSTQDPITQIRVSYPKFKTKYGTYISFKNGIWNNSTSSYNPDRLKIINIPVLKSHWTYGVTGCIKHYMGVVTNGLGTNSHNAMEYGAMGTVMRETRFPTLNIIDAIWVNAIPYNGPPTSYGDGSFTNIIGASEDPVALEYWASKYILIPAAIQKGHTDYSSLDPDHEPGIYHNYLERSMNELKDGGYQVTMNETEMNVYVSLSPGIVHNLNTGLNYATIQSAINAGDTLDGHALSVGKGVYFENIIVNKSLTLIGENRSNTIIDGNKTGTTVLVAADGVTIREITVKNGETGIYMNTSDDSRCSANNVVENVDAILVHSSENFTIYDNNVGNNTHRGILITNSNNFTVVSNYVYDNEWYGINANASTNGLISQNYVCENYYDGIGLHNSSNCRIVKNTVKDNVLFGIWVDSSYGNLIYHNNLINNGFQVGTTPPPNLWDDGLEGNYWSDFNGTDADHDGIGESWYEIDQNNTDRFPLAGVFHSFNTSSGYHVNVVSNSTIEDFEYFESTGTIRMYVSNMTTNQTHGFSRVTFPKGLVSTPYNVTINDGAIEVLHFNDAVYQNESHQWIYFAYKHSRYKIEIVPEFPTSLILPILMTATLMIALFYVRKRAMTSLSKIDQA